MNTFWFCRGWLFYSDLFVVMLFCLVFISTFLHGFGIVQIKKKNPFSSEWDFIAPLAGLQSIATLVAFFGPVFFKPEAMEKVGFFEGWMFFMMIILFGFCFFIVDIIIAVIGYIMGLAIKAMMMPFIRSIKK